MHLVADEKKWFKEIFDEHHNYIRNYLYYLSGDPDLSDDLLQDTYLKLWEVRDKVKKESVVPYLFTIARHLYFRSHRRKALSLKFLSLQEEPGKEVSADYQLEMKEFDNKLQQALSLLSEKTRTVFLLSRMDNMTNPAIADSLRLSVKNIEKHITKAKKLLREQIGHNV